MHRVVPLITRPGASGREGGAFSLLFAAPTGTAVPQAILPVRHPTLGVMEIFLVPIVRSPAQRIFRRYSP